MNDFSLLSSRRWRRLPLALLALLPLALTGCDRADVNAQTQAGAWHIERLSVQRGLAPTATTTTLNDPGDVSFTATANTTESGRAQFYFDKPSGLQSIGGLAGTSFLYTADAFEQNRVVLTKVFASAAPGVFIYTLTKAGASQQHWQLIGVDAEDRINYREDWELKRL